MTNLHQCCGAKPDKLKQLGECVMEPAGKFMNWRWTRHIVLMNVKNAIWYSGVMVSSKRLLEDRIIEFSKLPWI